MYVTKVNSFGINKLNKFDCEICYVISVKKYKKEKSIMSEQKYVKLNNGVEMPVTGIGTFLLSPDEAEASVLSALQGGYRLIDTANAYVKE